jgi:glycosyltransferase involved in cell wall biosynthesis
VSEALVSVVVPTWNRAYCLPDTLDSVFAQSHQRFESVVLDDGSTDDTLAMLAARYPDDRLRVLHQENAGVSTARNAALAEVRGDFVAFLDSDDEWFPDKLELQLACFEAFPEAVMVWTDMMAVDPSGALVDPTCLRSYYHGYSLFESDDLFERSRPLARIAPRLAHRVGGALAHFGDIYGPMMFGSLVHTSTVMLRAETMRAVGGFDVELKLSGEDYDYHPRTCHEGPAVLADIATIR